MGNLGASGLSLLGLKSQTQVRVSVRVRLRIRVRARARVRVGVGARVRARIHLVQQRVEKAVRLEDRPPLEHLAQG